MEHADGQDHIKLTIRDPVAWRMDGAQAGSVWGQVPHQRLNRCARLDRRHFGRASLKHHGADSTGAGPDLGGPLCGEFGHGEKRLHNVAEQSERTIIPGIVRVGRPLPAKVGNHLFRRIVRQLRLLGR